MNNDEAKKLCEEATSVMATMLQVEAKRTIELLATSADIGVRINLVMMGRTAGCGKGAAIIVNLAGAMTDDDMARFKTFVESFCQDINTGQKMDLTTKVDQLGLGKKQAEQKEGEPS